MSFSNDEIESLIWEHYQKKVQKIKALPGEVDLNYYVEDNEGNAFVFKIARSGEAIDNLDLQNQALLHLAKQGLDLQLPAVVTDQNGKHFFPINDEQGEVRMIRMLTWVSGRLWAKVNPHTPELLNSLGQTLGTLCQGLSNFDHPAAHRFYKWDIAQANWTAEHLSDINIPEQQATARYFLELFQRVALPLQSKLRKSIIYNDANDYNVLVSTDRVQPKVAGVIDFGDAIFTHTVNDFAIAAAYALMYKPDPLAAAVHLVKGFHEQFPLQEAEIAALFPLIGARLLTTVTVAAINQKEHPDNEYLQISAQPAWQLLQKLRNIDPNFAHYTFRAACGLTPCPQQTVFKKWMEETPETFHPIVEANFEKDAFSWLDLSVGSLALGNNSHYDDSYNFNETIRRLTADGIGVGGYLETRPFYTTDNYIVPGNEGPKWRTVHLGLDIWMAAGTPVYAPISGVVHSVSNNAGERNYGPTVILKHEPKSGFHFYTLYGHLSVECLTSLKKGMSVKSGEQIAAIGPPPENGNWPPHLHFQVLLDMLSNTGDFPGVSFPDEKEVWASICPDPNLLLQIPSPEQKSTDLSIGDILSQRQQFLGRSLSVSYQKPLKIVRAYKQYLYAHDGQRYLDTVNNVPHVGHQHPKVVAAAQQQMGVLNTNTRYLHENIIRFARELCATLPDPLSVCHFVNSGSEANELALRMARAYTGQRDMIAVEVGYHGNTGGCVDISSYKFDGKGGKGAPESTHIVPIPDTYRGLYRRDDPKAGEKYAAHLQRIIENLERQGRGIAGFIAESILSCGGQIVPPVNYFKQAFEYVRKAGGVCIVDEVQVGFGRVGQHFWGFELQGVVPDIVTMGKPIGNGHPLGAVVTTPKIAEAFANGMEYFNTFGGNPVSCAIGRAVLRVIQEEDLQEQALHTGKYLTEGLHNLQQQYDIIGDVRGPGLFLGFELIRNPETLEPADLEASYLANRMRQHGILMSTDGPFHNVLKIKPPMCFNRSNVDFLLETLDKVLREDFLRKG